MEVVGELQDCVDVESLALKLLRHREADDLSVVDFGDGERWFVRAEDLGDFRVEEKFEIGAERSLHAAKLLRRLVEIGAERQGEFMGTLVSAVHELFDGRLGIFLIEQDAVDVGNRDVNLDVPKNLERGLDRELGLGRKERIAAATTGE